MILTMNSDAILLKSYIIICYIIIIIIIIITIISRNRDSVAGIATGYGLEDRGIAVRVPVGSRIFSSPRRPYRLWGPPNLLSNGYVS
jgi:hypothetical protein